MKVYIWQNNKGNKWYIHWDIDHPLGWQMRGMTHDLFTRTTLTHESIPWTGRFRLNPNSGLGEIFNNKSLAFYQFLLYRDEREDDFEKCILISEGKWLTTIPKQLA